MIIIPVKPDENIDRAIKRYKQKTRKIKQIKTLRDNKYFTKKSQKRREEIEKAKYREEYERSKEI